MARPGREEEGETSSCGEVHSGAGNRRERLVWKLLAVQVFLYHLATFSSGRPKPIDVLVLFTLINAVFFALATAVMLSETMALPPAALEHRYLLAASACVIATWWAVVCVGVLRRSKLAWLATPLGAAAMLLLGFGAPTSVSAVATLVASMMPGARAWFMTPSTSFPRGTRE